MTHEVVGGVRRAIQFAFFLPCYYPSLQMGEEGISEHPFGGKSVFIQ